MVRAHLELAHTAWPLDTWQSRIRETAQIRGKTPSCACRPRPLGFCRPPKADVRFSSPPAVRGREKRKEKKGPGKVSKFLFSCEPVSPEFSTRRLCLGCCVCVAALVSSSSVLCAAESVFLRCADAAGGCSLSNASAQVFSFSWCC